MKYSLIVDIGNSQVEVGLFKGDELVNKTRVDTNRIDASFDESFVGDFLAELRIDLKDIEGGIIFSVVPRLTEFIQTKVNDETGIRLDIFDPKVAITKYRASIDNPNEVGQDLIADIIGAIHFYGVPIAISDLGTVTKNIVIDKDGIFQAVSFIPGLQTSAASLLDHTAALPEITMNEKPTNYVGKNTIDAIKSGIYYSHVASIKDFFKRNDDAYGYKFKKVITGGFSLTIEDEFDDEEYIVDQTLVLKGMHYIYKYMR